MSTLTVSLIQTDLHWEDKTANLEMLEKKINSIAEKTELVVLPEMFSTGFSMNPSELAEPMDGNAVRWMQRIAKEKKIILTGSLIIQEEDLYYNRMIWMLPNGEFGIYDKRHLFAYAGEDQHYKSGNKRLIASVKGWKINLQVCYDLRFPVWARQQPHDESSAYDMLIYVANWPDKRANAWKTLLQARAIENQSYVIGVNRVGTDPNGHHYNGDSMIVDPLGKILYHKEETEDIVTMQLEKSTVTELREKLPFWKDSDGFKITV